MTALDTLDETILKQRIIAWNARQGPRIGDTLLMRDGSFRRLAHDYGAEIQTTSASQPTDQSFYFGHGYCSFSGSLGEVIAKDHIEDTGTIEPAPVWYFHHDQARAFNAVHATIPCRVFRFKNLP